MLDRIASGLHHFHAFGWTALLIALTSLVTAGAGAAVVLAIPADFFLRDQRRPRFWHAAPAARVALLVGKNLAGAVVFLAGVVMAVPLVPGPGLLFMLLGLGLLDFPGKRALERRLLRMPRVLGSVNRLRARFGKPPLLTEDGG